MRRRTSVLILVAVVVLTGAVGTMSNAVGTEGDRRDAAEPAMVELREHGRVDHWVNTWTAMPQLTEPHNMPPPPFTGPDVVLADSTLRQTVRVSVGGSRLRLRFSNAFGGAVLPITAVSVAAPAAGQAGVDGIEPGTARPVTFAGRSAVDIPVGAQMVSDPLSFSLAPATNLTVTVYLADGQASTAVTSHPGSRTTSHLLAGNHVADERLPGATPTDHWYFLSGVEVSTRHTADAVAVLGDSLTDGRGSTTNGNDRWPDRLVDRLRSDRRTADVAVLNQAAGGNRVLADGLGPNVLARLDRDVLAQSGVRWLIVFHGVNDIGVAPATEAAQKQVARDLIAGFEQIVVRSQAMGITVYGATLLPFGGHDYGDPAGHREAARQTVNEWIRTSGQFAEVIDFDRVSRDPANSGQLNPAYDVGDHLHLNPTGYQALADAVPARLFR
ncbi:SGNH/GDSL hydrolase family protein [Actinophytocola sediminis]